MPLTLIWLTAAIGMVVGAGEALLTVLTTAFILTVLMLFPRLEFWIDRLRHSTSYEVVLPVGPDRRDELLGLFSECRLRVRRIKRSRYPRGQVYAFDVHGTPDGMRRRWGGCFSCRT